MKEILSLKKQAYWTFFLLLCGMHLLLTAYLNSSFNKISPLFLPQHHSSIIADQRVEQFQSIHCPKKKNNNETHRSRRPRLRPLWKCHDHQAVQPGGRPEKVIFVHVFKTAGMSIRELLLRYAVSCHAGIGLVAECSGVSAGSWLNSEPHFSSSSASSRKKKVSWVNGFGSKQGKPCRVKAIDRHRNDISLPKLLMDQSQLAHMDLLAGHISLGVGSAFSSSSQNNNNIQYITFFRNAMAKFVSGIMYQKKDQHYSFQDIVTLIRKRVRSELKHQKYREGYSAYLLTPQQKQMLYGGTNHTAPTNSNNNNTAESRTQQIIHNLQRENIVCGIVERMSESLELIQYVLDSDGEQTPLFESFGMVVPGGVHVNRTDSGPPTSKKVNNPSKFSTDSVIAELKNDAEFFAQLQEYVKFDEQIYSQALKLHHQQYQWLQQERLQNDIITAEESNR